MTLDQFKLLPQPEQYNTVWERGLLMDARMTSQYKFILYRIDGFYIEIQYDNQNNERVGLDTFITWKSDYIKLN